MATSRPGDYSPKAKRIDALLRWVTTTRPSPARNRAMTFNHLLRNDLQPIYEEAEKAGESDRRDVFCVAIGAFATSQIIQRHQGWDEERSDHRCV